MSHFLLVLGCLLSLSVFAREEQPIEKVKLAIGEADLVLKLAGEATEADPALDKMCTRLGRFTAIMRRVRGSDVVPPETLRLRLHHYENFCGWAPRPTDPPTENLMPRAFDKDVALTLERIRAMKSALTTDRNALEKWTVEAAQD